MIRSHRILDRFAPTKEGHHQRTVVARDCFSVAENPHAAKSCGEGNKLSEEGAYILVEVESLVPEVRRQSACQRWLWLEGDALDRPRCHGMACPTQSFLESRGIAGRRRAIPKETPEVSGL